MNDRVGRLDASDVEALDVATYRRRPEATVDAVQVTETNPREVIAWLHARRGYDVLGVPVDYVRLNTLQVLTLEGTLEAPPGYWVLVGADADDVWVCHPEIFARRWERVCPTLQVDEVTS